MSTTPKKRGGAPMFNSPFSKFRNGLCDDDGVWHCKCNPRYAAVHRQTKNEGKNHGRWFYTCKWSEGDRCNFFLWEDDARTTSLAKSLHKDWGATPGSGARGMGGATPMKDSVAKLGKADNGEDEFGDWPLSPQEEEEAVASVADRLSIPPETPKKAVKTSMFSTPGSKKKREETLPTPVTGASQVSDCSNEGYDSDIFSTPATASSGSRIFGVRSPSNTPTPYRFRDAGEANSSPPQTPQVSYDFSDEVLELLQGQGLNEKTTEQLKSLLSRHAMKDSGIVKGRDITRAALKAKDLKNAELRAALKAKDLKIAELQEKNERLEGERELDNNNDDDIYLRPARNQ